ncbi:hypothetical protein AHAS_Ahas13G0260500 [Arachis hypogaea]
MKKKAPPVIKGVIADVLLRCRLKPVLSFGADSFSVALFLPFADTGWLFQKIYINFAAWGYAVFTADLLDHGRSDSGRA